MFIYKSKYKKIGVFLIRIVKSNVSTVKTSHENVSPAGSLYISGPD